MSFNGATWASDIHVTLVALAETDGVAVARGRLDSNFSQASVPLLWIARPFISVSERILSENGFLLEWSVRLAAIGHYRAFKHDESVAAVEGLRP